MVKRIISSKDLINLKKSLFSLPFIFFAFFALLLGQNQTKSGDKVYYEGDKVRIQQKSKIITITGNAFIRKGTQGLKADKIIWYQNEEYAEAFDNVSFLDREQGVLYKGNYVKFLIERDIVYVKEKPSIENRKDNVIIFADTFKANTKSGSINAEGNTRMTIQKNPEKPIYTTSQDADYSTANNKIILKKNAVLKTVDQWFSADQIDIDQDQNFLILNKNVRIEDSPDQKKRSSQNQNSDQSSSSNSLGDSILTCDRSKIFTETKYLECFGNVVLENKTDQTILKSDYFLFDNPKNELLATKKVSYHQKTLTNERYMFSEYMKIYMTPEIMYFTNDTVFIDIDAQKTNMQLNCYSMKYNFAKSKSDDLECFQDVVIYNPEENSRVFSDYFYYVIDSGVGHVEESPRYLKEQEKKNLFFYSDRMDIDRRKNIVKLNKDVLIVEEEKLTQATNSTVKCNKGEFLYYTENDNDTFTCTGNVDVYMTLNKTHFYGDQLVYYLQKEYSRLNADDKVLFNYEKSSTNAIRGSADYAENFHNLGYSVMSNDVFATETVNGRPINRIKSQEVRYHFLSQSNAFEGFRDVVYEDLDNNNTLYSDYLFYDLSLDQGWASGKAVLVAREEQEKDVSLIYAERINLDNKNKRSHLVKDVNIFKTSGVFLSPPRTPQIPPDKNYLKCQEANYFFPGDERLFECVKTSHLVDRDNRIDAYSDYLIYNIDTEYGFLKDRPYLVSKRNISNTYYIYSETMEFFRDQGVSLFHTNVLTKEINNLDGRTNSTINCNESKYVFLGATNTIECFKNVKVVNYLESYVITSDYLRHQVDDDYSYVSEKAEVIWSGDKKPTVVNADLFENFGKENLLYAKGNVKVDNGENEAESSLGIYEPVKKKFTLYGNPKVRDKQGSEFVSEEVYFDVAKNTMSLGSAVEGNFIPEGFLDQ